MSGKKRKGLSGDEKRDVILRCYHEALQPFNLKEIENMASKAGVVLQTVKEHNQALVDDNLVMTDKIGSSVFFWAFPSQALHERRMRLRAASEGAARRAAEQEQLQRRVEELRATRTAPDRAEKLRQWSALQAEEAEADRQLALLAANDPEALERTKQQAKACREAAERWTENVWTLKRYLTKKRGLPGKDVDRMLGIDDSFDVPEYKRGRK